MFRCPSFRLSAYGVARRWGPIKADPSTTCRALDEELDAPGLVKLDKAGLAKDMAAFDPNVAQ